MASIYRMVGNFREVFIFAFFVSQKPFAKIKTAKILLPTCKANEPHFNPWPTSIQQPTKACQRVWLWRLSLTKCYINTDAPSRQWRKAESRSNRRGSLIHRSRKLKPRKFLKSEFWPISRKFVPAKITNLTVHLLASHPTVWRNIFEYHRIL